MIIDSFDTRPIKIPKTMMHRSIIIKDCMKITKFAFLTKKNGINGTKPPKNGAKPFTKATNIPAKLSALS